MGICLDDSFETVSRKLGLLREDIIPGSYSWDTQGHIYVEYTPPEENMDGEIYISKDNYSFSYWFEPQGKLYSYTVDIY